MNFVCALLYNDMSLLPLRETGLGYKLICTIEDTHDTAIRFSCPPYTLDEDFSHRLTFV